MRTLDSRGTLTENGQKMCIICGRRPQRRTPRGKWLSYCAWCAAQAERDRRAAAAADRAAAAAERKIGRTVRMQLTPEESRVILEARAVPAGRHHAR